MARLAGLWCFQSDPDLNSTINAGASSAEIVIGSKRQFIINATQDVMIKRGVSGMGAATAADFRIPAGVVATLDLGEYNDRIRLFNNGSATASYWIAYLGN